MSDKLQFVVCVVEESHWFKRLSTLKQQEFKIGHLAGKEGRLAPACLRVIQPTLPRAMFMLLVFIAATPLATMAQDRESQKANAEIAQQLSSPDPLLRQRAAEELARLAAVDQKKLLEGYYLVEKDRKVRLALEWALYRIGKTEVLFRIVDELDSSRHNQAVGYLKQVESPSVIYPFLKRERKPRIVSGLLEALTDLGDDDTLEIVRPFRDSFAPGVAAAAEDACDKIEARLAQTEPAKPGRPRTVSKTGSTSP